MAYTDRVAGSKRLSIIAGVAVVHGALGYLFVTGMAVNFVGSVTRTLTTTNIPVDPPPPIDQPPPPKPPIEKALPAATQRTAPRTIIDAPASTWTVAVDPGPFTSEPPILARSEPATTPPPTTPSLASGPRVSGNRTSWFSTNDYPPSAIRAEEQGVVKVQLGIGPDGRVSSCTVTATSGSSALDLTTCRLYQKRARFAPARDETGGAIASTYVDRVVWRLPER